MKPLAWSFSSLKQFLTCPRQLQKLRVTKEFKEEWAPETKDGTIIHKALQDYISDSVPLPEIAQPYQKYADKLKAMPGLLFVEREFAIDRSLQPCPWFSKKVWGRAKTDVFVLNGSMASTVDHKTGKRKLYTEIDQLMINALFVFAHYPTVNTCRVAYSWLKEKRVDSNIYYRRDIPVMWSMLLPVLTRYRNMFKDEEFPPQQSGLCRGWCPVNTCEFWSPKKSDGAKKDVQQ